MTMCRCQVCDCENLLTVSDIGGQCRQCSLGSHSDATAYMSALAAANFTDQHGGGTFTRDKFHPCALTEGYAVGGAYGNAQLIPVGYRVEIAHAIIAVRDEYPKATHIGTWVEDGQVAIDPVFIVDDYDDAMGLAILNGQKAIYSFAENKEIVL